MMAKQTVLRNLSKPAMVLCNEDDGMGSLDPQTSEFAVNICSKACLGTIRAIPVSKDMSENMLDIPSMAARP